MTRWAALLVGAGMLVAVNAALADSPGEARSHWHQAIAADYQALAQQASALERQVGAACDDESPWQPESLRQQWEATFLAWQAVRYVDFGPIEQSSRAWQIQFWPDRKNLVARKAGLWLQGDPTPTIDRIAADSVAIQGLPALEYLLFDPKIAPQPGQAPAAMTCQLMVAVAGNLAKVTGSLEADWAAFKPHFLATESYNTAVVTAAMTGLEVLQNRRLAEPMGLGGNERRNAYLADAWRSGQSLAGLEASIAGMKHTFLPGVEVLLAAAGEQALHDQLAGQIDATLAAFTSLPAAMGPLLDDANGYRQLQALYIEVSQLYQLLTGQVAPALGVVRGFNSSDGD